MANHRATGRPEVRKHRTTGGTHRDAALPASAVKVGVLGVLATATIAAPLAAAAAGVDESAVSSETVAQAAAPAAPIAQQQAAVAIAPVAIPTASEDSAAPAAETREASAAADRSEERTAPAAEATATADENTADTGIEVSVPEPEPVVAEAAATGTSSAGTAAPATANESGYIRPVDGVITSGYGGRVHPVLGYFKGHDGVDFGAACGTPVKAVKSGTVVAVEYHSASGNRVKVDHGNGVITGYYHLQGFNTSVGATVSQGDVVGYVGSTGRSTGCHLHFATMDEAGNYSNPMSILR
ncbi:M23 family metallopeptidase [Brachybacterium aquaticum]|uniref:Murein DD-endopeptidase MepM/ murein hydrolase activator NlpD n=1 Tax=Brachybacterium aquaticum TaxID=1432564 RepID=A0A841ACL1_9MICO|nr:M23 family metallopeptidase [Brachybacterium aquaticum]MBB5831085.1 murein DD-endopeptidase MepM/ murein hydrolase activator NlpD [Brachybacterium aquaticum]